MGYDLHMSRIIVKQWLASVVLQGVCHAVYELRTKAVNLKRVFLNEKHSSLADVYPMEDQQQFTSDDCLISKSTLNTYFNTQLIIKCAIYRPSGRPGCRN